jgi:hypothetical protein
MALDPYGLALNRVRDMRQAAEMPAARSDPAAATASPRRSCPYPRRRKQTLGQTSMLRQMRHWVLVSPIFQRDHIEIRTCLVWREIDLRFGYHSSASESMGKSTLSGN